MHMKKIAHTGALAVIIAALLWSVDGLLRRHLYSLPPSVIVFWEHSLGLVFIVPFLIKTREKFRELTRKQWWAMGLVALLSGALGTIFYLSLIHISEPTRPY